MDPSASFLRRPTEAPWPALKFVKVIGEGRFGTVWLCEDGRTGEQYACKKVLKASLKDSLLHQHFLRQEVALLDSMAGQHPHIIELKYVFEDHEAIYLMMEFCDVGDLFTYVTNNGCTVSDARSSSSGFGMGSAKSGGRSSGDDGGSSGKQRAGVTWGLPENKAVLIFRQVAQALLFCHKNGIMHRDIKLENVLLSSPDNASGPQYYYCSALPPPSVPKPTPASDTCVVARLADFGLAVRLGQGEKTVGTAGSRPYEAPEVILGQEYDMKADVWSLGVLLYGMLSCSMPFQGHGDRQLIRQILRGNVDLTRGAWPSVSAEAKDLIRAMLSVNPGERISMAEVVAHPWIKAASRRNPVINTSAVAGVSEASTPMIPRPSTPKSPLYAMVRRFGHKKNVSTSDLPSLDPCNEDKFGVSPSREHADAFLENNTDKEIKFASRKSRNGKQEQENSLPPLPPTIPGGSSAAGSSVYSSIASSSIGSSGGISSSVSLPSPAGAAEKQSGKGKEGKALHWDSWFPAVSPSRGKWRMGF